jgi:hypothetical protein
MESLKFWDGDEWQKHITNLLKMHYPLGDFVEIPDRDGGDNGIEGFTRDGNCFQCYAPVEPLSVDELYKKQRKKMTDDINKFIKNKEELAEFFGPTKITRWILVVPRHDTSKLVAHAERKAKLVRESNLPYVGEEFFVHIVEESYFKKELNILRQSETNGLNLTPTEISNDEIEKWIKENQNDLLVTLENKINKLPTLDKPEKVIQFRNEMIRHFITGQNTIDFLKDNHPYIYENLINTKRSRESYLATESLLHSGDKPVLLNDSMGKYSEALKDGVKGISSNTANILVLEAISDWLIRCPLDFY